MTQTGTKWLASISSTVTFPCRSWEANSRPLSYATLPQSLGKWTHFDLIFNLWWMPKSVSEGFGPTMSTSLSRRCHWYPKTYKWVSSQVHNRIYMDKKPKTTVKGIFFNQTRPMIRTTVKGSQLAMWGIVGIILFSWQWQNLDLQSFAFIVHYV